MAEVRFDAVSKIYPGGVRAVENVTLHVQDGELVVLVGPSGCGKTTLLRLVAGLEEVTEGRISIGQRVVNRVPAKDRDVAMVFQNYALYPHMTISQNLAFGLKRRGLAGVEIRRRIAWAAELLEIGTLLERKPQTLSGGQRQRAAVGRAIVRQPKVFLLDEPLSNLDARLRIELRGELKQLHQRLGTTMLYVTHDQEEAMTLGDRVVVLDRGRVQQSDTPLAAYRHPANRFVAGFLGMPPISFVEGTLVTEEVGLRFQGGGIDVILPEAWVSRLQGPLPPAVVLGIRPEAVRLDGKPSTGAGTRLTVTVVEPLGSAMDVCATTTAGVRIMARVAATDAVRCGETFSATLDPAGLHLFEPGEYGANLNGVGG